MASSVPPQPPPQKAPASRAGGAARPAANPLEFRPVDLSGSDLGSAPFANQAISVEEFGVRWWFQYFWQEAKMVAKETDRTAMAAICNQLFIKTPGGPHKYKVKDAFKDDDHTTANPGAWKQMLTQLLHIGFRRVDPKETVQTTPQGPPVPQVAAHHLMLRTDLAPLLPSKYTPETEIFWRSESRTLERILEQQGTKRQSDVAFLAKDMNMSAPWHPYSDPDINKYMWFRLGQGDNDYYTVISVATDFETALAFPKIDEARIYGFPKRSLDEWTQDEVQRHHKNLAKVTHTDGSEHIMLATKTTAYMCVAAGRIIDTRTAGGKIDEVSKKLVGFPEKGVSEIPLDQIFALLPVTRIHHGPEPADGFTAFIDHDRGRYVFEDVGKAMDLFGDAYQRLKDEYFKQKYRVKVVTAWGANGATDPKKAVPVSRIIEFPASAADIQQFKSARRAGVNALSFISQSGAGIKGMLKETPKKP